MSYKKIAVLTLIWTLFIPATLLSQIEEEEEVLVPSIDGIIKIDGLGKEIEWEKASWTSNFWMWETRCSYEGSNYPCGMPKM